MGYLEQHKIDQLSKKEQLAYLEGLTNGIEAFAWWKNGTQYVGTCGTVLRVFMRPLEERINELQEEINREA